MKVLIITDLYPPDPGGRAEKMLRHAKYFSINNVSADILCPATICSQNDHETGFKDGRCYRVFPIGWKHLKSLKWQESFLPDTHLGFLLRRLRFPVGYMRWFIPALLKAVKLIRNKQYCAFITVSNPASMQIIGLILHLVFPKHLWLAELRDPLVGYYRSRHSDVLNRLMESLVVQKAGAIVEWRDFSPNPLNMRHKKIKNKYFLIPTVGYDPDEFARPVSLTPGGPLQIIYTGGYYGEAELWETFIKVISEQLNNGEDICFHHYGDWTEIQENFRLKYLNRNDDKFVLHGRVTKDICISAILKSHVVLYLLAPNDENLKRVGSKLYDYLAAQRPVLAIVPQGSLAQKVLMKHSPDYVLGVNQGDIEVKQLRRIMQNLLILHKSRQLDDPMKKINKHFSCAYGETIFIKAVVADPHTNNIIAMV
jgi:glycosyltransferase involved in cell wall biosynthesis